MYKLRLYLYIKNHFLNNIHTDIVIVSFLLFFVYRTAYIILAFSCYTSVQNTPERIKG